MTSKPAFSIAICTYNRSESVARTLDSLTKLQVPEGLDWELLLVNNNSFDETENIARFYAERLPLRYLFERNQGLSHARNRAIVECTGDLLIFTDDDVVVDNNWLHEYKKGTEMFRNAAFFGGRVVPLWESTRPAWLKDENMPLLSGLLVNYNLGRKSRWFESSDQLPYGANFAITRELYEKIGAFRPDLGVKGDVPGRGEEADYLVRATRVGFRGAYLSNAICYHSVDKVRFSLGYLHRYGIQKGIAIKRMSEVEEVAKGSFGSEVKYGLKGVWQFLKGRGDRACQCVINMGIQRGLRVDCRNHKF